MAKRTHGVYDRCEYDIRNIASLPNGVYTVSKDIENPNYDKRSEDFNRQPVIEAGTKVLVRNRTYEDSEGNRKPFGCRISKLGSRSFNYFEPDYFAYEPLMAALVPVEVLDTDEYLENQRNLNGYSASSDAILQRLLINGIVTREQVEAAIADNDIEN